MALITIGYALGIIFSIVVLVGAIMLIVKVFEKEEGSKGAVAIILAIFCSPALYIWGWVKVREWDAKKAMIIWTIGLIGSIVGWGIVVTGVMLSPEVREAMEREMERAAEEGTHEMPDMPDMPDMPGRQ